MSLRTDSKISLRRNVPLSHYCTMQVGGPARYFAEPACEEELAECLEFVRAERLPYFLLGKGSNVVFPDEGYPGLVITLIHYEKDRLFFDEEKMQVTVSSGTHLYRLSLGCRDRGFGGVEFLANIPGTVGGALIMNAGFSRFPGQVSEIGDLVEEAVVMNPDGTKEALPKDRLQFVYRRSNLEGRIILHAKLQLWRRRPEAIQQEIRANFDYRNEKQDLRFPSSGSIFKNPAPPLPSAGKLIEKAGLKGMRVGGMKVSDKHGNYFVNSGGARSADLIKLIEKVQKTVWDATQIFLETEVRIIEKPKGV